MIFSILLPSIVSFGGVVAGTDLLHGVTAAQYPELAVTHWNNASVCAFTTPRNSLWVGTLHKGGAFIVGTTV
ncbi:hypothetical protein [Xenorhabdus bovienii]|uniref:hypothetical protein n=1 Tax=Xenorhabdus bovienii TaxID=40576 RepID=UPI0023B337E4|nr:hypothetical protein [Xenorhabdus bovienii]MDE9549315.1 hypothetical protein [Xenorhabdus bovienii]